MPDIPLTDNPRDTTELAPRWYFNTQVDLEQWLACITTDPCQDAQDNAAYAQAEHLVCAFAKGFEPRLRHAVTLAASKEMLALLRECQKRLPAANDDLLSRVTAVIDLVDSTPDVDYHDIEKGKTRFTY